MVKYAINRCLNITKIVIFNRNLKNREVGINMIKKILGSMLILPLAASSLFAVTPTQAQANESSPKSIQVQAPKSIQVLAAPATEYFVVNVGGTKKPYIYYSTSANGTIYRGYLGFYKTTSAGHWYSGDLYRQDLPYPMDLSQYFGHKKVKS